MDLNEGASRGYHHGDLRQALLDAGLALLAEERDWTFSIRELARRAGVSHSAPNKHFASKRDLLAALAEHGFARLRDHVRAQSAGVEPADMALAATGVAYVAFATANPALYRLMFGAGLAGAGSGAKAVFEEAIGRAARDGLLRFSGEDVQAQAIAALTCWSAVHGLATLIIDGAVADDQPPAMQAGAMVGYLMRGIRR